MSTPTLRLVCNRARCNHCHTIVESRHRWEFKWCPCGKIAVDGGLEYTKRTGNPDDYTEMSEYVERTP